MKYLCLIYTDETAVTRMTSDELASRHQRYGAFTDSIKAAGHLLGGNALQPTGTAVTVRVRNGTVSTTDGPFAETKEQLGGYYLVEARDLNEAIQLAARIPGAHAGAVEVRPIVPMN